MVFRSAQPVSLRVGESSGQPNGALMSFELAVIILPVAMSGIEPEMT